MSESKEKWGIAFGQLVEGHEFIGPFDSEQEAWDYINDYGLVGAQTFAMRDPKEPR